MPKPENITRPILEDDTENPHIFHIENPECSRFSTDEDKPAGADYIPHKLTKEGRTRKIERVREKFCLLGIRHKLLEQIANNDYYLNEMPDNEFNQMVKDVTSAETPNELIQIREKYEFFNPDQDSSKLKSKPKPKTRAKERANSDPGGVRKNLPSSLPPNPESDPTKRNRKENSGIISGSHNYRKDITKLLDIIAKVHPLNTKDWQNRFQKGKEFSKSLPKTITSYNEFVFASRKIINEFEDGHFYHRQKSPLKNISYAGIVAEYSPKDKKLVVVASKTKLVPKGSVIKKLNNTQPESHLNSMIYSYGGVKKLPAYMKFNSYRIFYHIEHQNHSKVQQLSILRPGEKKSITVDISNMYKTVSEKSMKNTLRKYKSFDLSVYDKNSSNPNIVMKKLPGNKLYIKIPMFLTNSTDDNKIIKFREDFNNMCYYLGSASNMYKHITIDIKSNSGGYRDLSSNLSHALFRNVDLDPVKTYLKLSKYNLYKYGFTTKVDKMKENSTHVPNSIVKAVNIFIAGKDILKTLLKGSVVFEHMEKSVSIDITAFNEPYKGKLDILIDEYIYSASLHFLEHAKKAQKTNKNIRICGEGIYTMADSPAATSDIIPIGNSGDYIFIPNLVSQKRRGRKYNDYFVAQPCG